MAEVTTTTTTTTDKSLLLYDIEAIKAVNGNSELFKMFVIGKTVCQIAKYLNEKYDKIQLMKLVDTPVEMAIPNGDEIIEYQKVGKETEPITQ